MSPRRGARGAEGSPQGEGLAGVAPSSVGALGCCSPLGLLALEGEGDPSPLHECQDIVLHPSVITIDNLHRGIGGDIIHRGDLSADIFLY